MSFATHYDLTDVQCHHCQETVADHLEAKCLYQPTELLPCVATHMDGLGAGFYFICLWCDAETFLDQEECGMMGPRDERSLHCKDCGKGHLVS